MMSWRPDMEMKPRCGHEAQIASLKLTSQLPFLKAEQCTNFRAKHGRKSCHQWRKWGHQVWEPQHNVSPDKCVCILRLLHYWQKLCQNRLASWGAEAKVNLSCNSSWNPWNILLFPRVKSRRGKALQCLLQRFTPKLTGSLGICHLQTQPRSAAFIFRGQIFGGAEHHHLP